MISPEVSIARFRYLDFDARRFDHSATINLIYLLKSLLDVETI